MTQHAPDAQRSPRFSIITAVYNVDRYLDDFIASVDAQLFPAERFEVIAVDDGSTDGSLALLREWAQRRPGLVTVITKENGGQASARNMGLDVARGEWVTFTDPDDMLEPEYLREVDRFLVEKPETVLVGTARILLNDSTGQRSNHPLRGHFKGGNRVHDLTRSWDHFYASAPCAFFRLETLQAEGLRFDPRIRPHFEDGYLCCEYLLRAEAPLVGFVASAHYIYRKRVDSSSTLRRSLTDPGRYTTVLERGYLAILLRAVELHGEVPEWLQYLIIYDLSWYFSSQDAAAGAVGATKGEVADEFHRLMALILEHVSDDVISSFKVRPLKRHWREILLHAYDAEPWHTPYALVVRQDPDQGLVKLVYDYTGEPPKEELYSNGRLVVPQHQKVRDISYHDRTLLKERIVWLPVSTLRVKLNGRDVDIRFSAPELPTHILRAPAIRQRMTKRPRRAAQPWRKAGRPAPGRPSTRADQLAARLAQHRAVRFAFGRSWVLMDRIHDADDSAERLFRYLRAERKDIDAWFVVEAGTPDWERLHAEGFGRRVVPHGSLRWKLLMANCQHLVSSHADAPVMRPPAITAFTEPSWRFTFLQHGVIKDDLSQWLNPKNIDLFITSTPGEHESIVGDGSPYTFTTKETKLTGLPRFDRLREKGKQLDPEQRDLLLVAPTWRSWLVPELAVGSQRRSLVLADFLETDYAKNWLPFLSSPELAEVCERMGLTIGFLPHPNIQPILGQLDLPAHVKALTFAGTDVQELFARSRLLVTDYSSVAFNAAYIDRPTVYFQFDRERVLSGGHVGRAGYFDYERDGFGPVAMGLEEALAATVDSLKAGPAPSPTYQARIESTFPLRDGRCCERVVGEIEALTRPVNRTRRTSGAAGTGTARSLTGRLGRRVIERVLRRLT